jgi:hypothetical protein
MLKKNGTLNSPVSPEQSRDLITHSSLSLSVLFSSSVITVYYPAGAQAALALGAGSGAAACNPTTLPGLSPPPLPGPTAVPAHFSIQPADNVPSGVYTAKSSFTLSVVNQVLSPVVFRRMGFKECIRRRSFCSFRLLPSGPLILREILFFSFMCPCRRWIHSCGEPKLS